MTTITVSDAREFEGDATEVNGLFLLAGKWFAPNKEFRKLLGNFGEPLVRTVIGNSSRAINPATLSPETSAVIAQVCESAKAEIAKEGKK